MRSMQATWLVLASSFWYRRWLRRWKAPYRRATSHSSAQTAPHVAASDLDRYTRYAAPPATTRPVSRVSQNEAGTNQQHVPSLVTQFSELVRHYLTLEMAGKDVRKQCTDALEAVADGNVEVGGQGARDGLAVGAQAAGQRAHLLRVEEVHRLLDQPVEHP